MKIRYSEHVNGGSILLKDDVHDIEIQVRVRYADAVDGGKAVNHIEITAMQYDGQLPIHAINP